MPRNLSLSITDKELNNVVGLLEMYKARGMSDESNEALKKMKALQKKEDTLNEAKQKEENK